MADTRIPDHTLWQHNGLVSALANCERGVSFMLFQIGPVQDFIRQARKTQDLWAGSFLLSYLIAQAMLAVAREIGPDAIVYPQLRGVPLADWAWHKQGILPGQLRASYPDELRTPVCRIGFWLSFPRDGNARRTAGRCLRLRATPCNPRGEKLPTPFDPTSPRS